MNDFEPRIVCFICKWCTYAGADLAGTSRLKHKPNTTNIRLMCSSRLNMEQIFEIFREGADGVFVGGCHPGDCHYMNGNYKTQKRIMILHRILKDFGIEPKRVRLEWISASEGKRYVELMDDFIEEIRELGPLEFSSKGDLIEKEVPTNG
ncbi:MAG: hydrogenase iron-sulfur subunit [Candidatus Stahlbacteria bacterium]|nr:MAG: hydrogenase iron-sulfur subunit [Candidatus Stahlbacteria bacterium]